MASYFTHGIFDPLSCTGTQWIVDKVMIEHSLHSVLICDIHTARFPLDCSRAAVCPCTLFRVRCRPHSEGCALTKKNFFTKAYATFSCASAVGPLISGIYISRALKNRPGHS